MANEIMLNSSTTSALFINKDLSTATRKILKLGSNMRKSAYEIAHIIATVESNKSYEEDGFKNVHEWTASTFGFKKSASYTLLAIGKEYTTEVIDEKGKSVGFGSNITIDPDADFTTTQIEKLLPVGHDTAVELVKDGTVTPLMTCKEIEQVVKAIKNPAPETEEETESEGGEHETVEGMVNDPEIRVIDDLGNEYLIPLSILEKYKIADLEDLAK